MHKMLNVEGDIDPLTSLVEEIGGDVWTIVFNVMPAVVNVLLIHVCAVHLE